ncbi:MAG: hypothetical protein ACYC6Y_18145 [Thermoguttaceae bacterium]
MSRHDPPARARPLRTIAILALVLWAVYGWWALGRVRQTGRLLRQALQADWSPQGQPRPASREKIAATAAELASGRAWSFGRALTPAPAPTGDERAAAARFLARHGQLRDRFLAATAAARDSASDPRDVDPVRDTLAKAYRAAVHADAAQMAVELDRAETMLAALESAPTGVQGPVDRQHVARLAAAIEPAWQLSTDLVTEGSAAAEKVLILAARSAAQERYAESASALRLAAELLGAQMTLPETAEFPGWFTPLADRPLLPADTHQAAAALQLAEAMVLSLAPGQTVAGLLKRARRRFELRQFAEARWWAAVTLNALGMSDAAIAAATGGQASPQASPADPEEADP